MCKCVDSVGVGREGKGRCNGQQQGETRRERQGKGLEEKYKIKKGWEKIRRKTRHGIQSWHCDCHCGVEEDGSAKQAGWAGRSWSCDGPHFLSRDVLECGSTVVRSSAPYVCDSHFLDLQGVAPGRSKRGMVTGWLAPPKNAGKAQDRQSLLIG